MTHEPHGLDRGPTNHGDRDFARDLRRPFARSTGISTTLLNKPVVGIAMTPPGSGDGIRFRRPGGAAKPFLHSDFAVEAR